MHAYLHTFCLLLLCNWRQCYAEGACAHTFALLHLPTCLAVSWFTHRLLLLSSEYFWACCCAPPGCDADQVRTDAALGNPHACSDAPKRSQHSMHLGRFQP